MALEARERLQADGVPTRVVSMPCWELFEDQDQAYRDQVLPPGVPARLAVEAAASFGWSRWVGEHGEVVSRDDFGASAPGRAGAGEVRLHPRQRGRPGPGAARPARRQGLKTEGGRT